MKRLHTIIAAITVICGILPQEISCNIWNLAMRRPTKQSSTRISWSGSGRAVDGNTNANFYAGSCSSTNDRLSGWHWWQVDLIDTYSVKYVNITNRADCCQSRLKDFSIEVSKEEPSTLPGFPQTTNASICMTRKDLVPSPGPVTYECNQPVEGRFVRLVKESPMNSPLVICEFEVYGNSIGPPNLALGKPTTQSTTNFINPPKGYAYKAVDGNTNGFYYVGSCSHTAGLQIWEWWQVDLQDTYIISAVRITNRQDCCRERLQNFTIEVSEENPSNLPGYPQTTNAAVCLRRKEEIPGPEPVMLECDQPVKGRYLRIVKENHGALTLCEVEVYESPFKTTKTPEEGRVNGKNELWRFIYISSHGSMDRLSPSALTQLMIDCARQRLEDRINAYENPYIHIDLHTGKCRFFEYAPIRSAQRSSNWVMYKLE